MKRTCTRHMADCLRGAALVFVGMGVPGVAAVAQPELTWVYSLAGSEYDYAREIEIDGEGNLFVAGAFSQTVDFDPGPGTAELTSSAFSDMFIAKYDADGGFIWVKQIESDGSPFVGDLAVDGDGAVFLSGSFGDTVDLDPGPGEFSVTASGLTDMYVVKLDANGNFQWAQWSEGSTGSTSATAGGVDTDATGNVYLTGSYAGTVDFDTGPGSLTPPWRGSTDIYVWKLDNDGNHVWYRHTGFNTVDNGRSICVDAEGNSYSIGVFHKTADFDPGSGTEFVTSAGQADGYVWKLDSDGELVWIRALGGAGSDVGQFIALDGSDLLIVGQFMESTSFVTASGTVSFTSLGNWDMFVGRMTTAGDLLWARHIGGEGIDTPTAIALGCAGNGYLAGTFENTVDFDPGAGVVERTSAGSSDGFLLRLNGGGLFEWLYTLGDTDTDQIGDVRVVNERELYVPGLFSGTVDFDPGQGTAEFTAAAFSDAYIAKFTDTDLSVCCGFGDINCDLSVDAVDVQLVINAALGLVSQFDADVNGDTSANAVDVQLVINTVLGL